MTDSPISPAVPDEIIQRLKLRHAEPQRHYHSWAHIEALLNWRKKLGGKINDPLAVELAILYHDAIYDPRSKENEAQSAALMRAELAGFFPAARLDKVEVLILATAGHRLPNISDAPLLSDCAFFLDMDLSILGSPPAAFDAYENAIRKEYSFVAPEDYRTGRCAILRNFLERKRLYFTDSFYELLEQQARRNLRHSLERLKHN